LNNIESNTQQAVINVVDGRQDLEKANDYARKRRIKIFIIILILLIIAGVIIGSVVGTQ
jgi:t-SNARE complex subunit (syntaxin)